MEGGGGEEAAEIGVAARVADEQRQARAVGEHRLGADDRLDAGRLRRLVEARDPVHPGAVGHRNGRQPERGGALRNCLRLGGAFEEGEGCVCMKLAESWFVVRGSWFVKLSSTRFTQSYDCCPRRPMRAESGISTSRIALSTGAILSRVRYCSRSATSRRVCNSARLPREIERC